MKEHFLLDRSTCYLDAASITPRARCASEAGQLAIQKSERPWLHRAWDKNELALIVRGLVADVIGASPLDIALTNSVSYGMATAAANLAVMPGSRILALEDDHPSSALIWERVAAERGASFEKVPRPQDGNWTAAVAARTDGAAPLSVAVLSPVLWNDGSVIDLEALAPRIRAAGAALVIDATQASGVLEIDVQALDADFVAFPAYKWLLGPYGLAFLYAAPRHHEGRALEEHMTNRKAPALRESGSRGDFRFKPGAERFDRGERDDGIILSIARAGIALSSTMSRSAKRELLWMLNDRISLGVTELGLTIAPRSFRAPHILGFQLPGLLASAVADELAQHGVFVSARRGFLRVSPYLYNNEEDANMLVAALRDVVAKR